LRRQFGPKLMASYPEAGRMRILGEEGRWPERGQGSRRLQTRFPQQHQICRGPSTVFLRIRQLLEDSLTRSRRRLNESNMRPTVPAERLLESVNRIKQAPRPLQKFPEDVRESLLALKPGLRRFHGIKIPLYWFPLPWSPRAS
jgi:hypothetical protein